jgi:hypothetical protein
MLFERIKLIRSQSIISIAIFIPAICCCTCAFQEKDAEFAAGLLLIQALIWLVALIVLVSDKKLRREINQEGHQYIANLTAPDGPEKIPDASYDIALNSGPFLGMVVMDALNV